MGKRVKMSQREKVLKYLDDFGSITQFEAFVDLGILRLSARIYDLVKMGYRFVKEQEKHFNRYGEATYCVRYKKAV